MSEIQFLKNARMAYLHKHLTRVITVVIGRDKLNLEHFSTKKRSAYERTLSNDRRKVNAGSLEAICPR